MPPFPSRFAVGALLLGIAASLADATLSRGLGAEPEDPPSPQQIRGTLDEAEKLLAAGKPVKAGGKLTAAIQQLDSLLELDRVPSGARVLADACKSLKEQLELEGIDVSGIKIPTVKSTAGKTAAGKTAAKPANPPEAAAFPGPRPAAASGPQAVSFVKQVAPILMSRCGGCHVTGRKGGFQMASYEGLMKAGVVQRGVGAASRLVEVIESGDMPRGGGKVAPDELATLKRWIDAGAAYDAPDPALGIDALARSLGGAAPAAAAAMPTGPVTLKPGDVSFAFDIAPVLLKNCCGCHDNDDPAENLSMVTFARLMRGGDSGPAVNAGRAAESLLLRKIKGMGIEGQRMPIGKPPLAPEVIALVEKWIAQGARLDLLTPKDPLENLAAAGRAKSLSHKELLKVRQAASEKLWQRVIGDEEPLIEPRGDVCLIGNPTKSQMEAVVAAAEAALQAAQRLLVGDDKPLLKGGIVVYVFAKPYDYSTFWQEVLDDERPKGLVGHAGMKGDVAYGAVVIPAAGTGMEEEEVAAQLTA
ncbi:MAG: c-type cytochrome domain-containing protein, partial [Planctomycetota bacterium]